MTGKWILKDIDSGKAEKGYSGFQLLEIDGSKAEFTIGFPALQRVSNLTIVENQIWTVENEVFARYEMVDESHLILFVEGKSNGIQTVFECHFYKLLPTITTLEKEEIEQLTFEIKSDDRKSELKFNQELWNKDSLKLFGKSKGEKRTIEQIDATFFVGIHYHQTIVALIPIKEVTTKFIKLYAIPTIPKEMIFYRK